MPKINTAYVINISLIDQADTKLLKANPTLAAGDVKVSTDDGAFANITTLPTVSPAAGRVVKVSLSAAEMNGNRVNVVFVDAAGAEWCDLHLALETTPDDVTLTNIANGLLDLSNGVETGFTLRQTLRLMASALAGKLSGAAGTSVTIRNIADTADRIAATVDANGNRTAVTLTP